jgi:hypothetical protein
MPKANGAWQQTAGSELDMIIVIPFVENRLDAEGEANDQRIAEKVRKLALRLRQLLPFRSTGRSARRRQRRNGNRLQQSGNNTQVRRAGVSGGNPISEAMGARKG